MPALGRDDEWTALPLVRRPPALPPEPLKRIGGGLVRAAILAVEEAEDAGRRRVAVLGPQVVEDLGVSTPDAIVGENIRIDAVQFQVVGVLASKGQGAGFAYPDDQLLVPIQTARYRLIGSDRLRSCSAAPTAESPRKSSSTRVSATCSWSAPRATSSIRPCSGQSNTR